MKIKVVDGLGDSKEFDLNEELEKGGHSNFSFWVGRADSCYIIIDDMSISREHARIDYADSKWIIKSEKRMLINGIVKDEGILAHGDIVTLGYCTLSVYNEGHREQELVSDGKAESGPEDVESNEDNFEDIAEASEGEEEGRENEEDEQAEYQDGEQAEYDEESFDSDDSDDSGYKMAEAEAEGDGKTQIIKGFSKVELDIFGEYAPYDTYVVEKNEVFIGRSSEKCEIVLSDPEVSGVHAVIKKSAVEMVLEDLDSANGILLNGERINRKDLTNGDEFLIGTTTFTVRMESDFIEDERLHLMPVEENQFVEVEEEVEFDEDELDDGQDEDADKSLVGQLRSLLSKDALRDPVKEKKLFILFWVLWWFGFCLMSRKTNPKHLSKR